MMNISGWVLSIIGICFISVVFDLISPDGKTNKSIKTVMSYAIIFVIASPLLGMVKNGVNVDDIFNSSSINIQSGYIYNLNQSKIDALKLDIEEGLNNYGFLGAQVSVSADIFDENMEIYAIYVDLYNLVISDNLKNKDIETEVKSVVQSYVDISKEKIIIYE